MHAFLTRVIAKVFAISIALTRCLLLLVFVDCYLHDPSSGKAMRNAVEGLELQEFEESLELVGIHMMAVVLEMVNDSAHCTNGGGGGGGN